MPRKKAAAAPPPVAPADAAADAAALGLEAPEESPDGGWPDLPPVTVGGRVVDPEHRDAAPSAPEPEPPQAAPQTATAAGSEVTVSIKPSPVPTPPQRRAPPRPPAPPAVPPPPPRNMTYFDMLKSRGGADSSNSRIPEGFLRVERLHPAVENGVKVGVGYCGKIRDDQSIEETIAGQWGGGTYELRASRGDKIDHTIVQVPGTPKVLNEEPPKEEPPEDEDDEDDAPPMRRYAGAPWGGHPSFGPAGYGPQGFPGGFGPPGFGPPGGFGPGSFGAGSPFAPARSSPEIEELKRRLEASENERKSLEKRLEDDRLEGLRKEIAELREFRSKPSGPDPMLEFLKAQMLAQVEGSKARATADAEAARAHANAQVEVAKANATAAAEATKAQREFLDRQATANAANAMKPTDVLDMVAKFQGLSAQNNAGGNDGDVFDQLERVSKIASHLGWRQGGSAEADKLTATAGIVKVVGDTFTTAVKEAAPAVAAAMADTARARAEAESKSLDADAAARGGVVARTPDGRIMRTPDGRPIIVRAAKTPRPAPTPVQPRVAAAPAPPQIQGPAAAAQPQAPAAVPASPPAPEAAPVVQAAPTVPAPDSMEAIANDLVSAFESAETARKRGNDPAMTAVAFRGFLEGRGRANLLGSFAEATVDELVVFVKKELILQLPQAKRPQLDSLLAVVNENREWYSGFVNQVSAMAKAT